MKATFRLLLTALISLSAIYTTAQTITGKVTDKFTGEPLSGATIQIVNTLKGVIADSKGNFSLKLPEKEITIRASFIGYASYSTALELKKGEKVTVNFALSSQSIEQDEVIVTCTRIATAKANIPLTASVINEKTIETSSEINLMPLVSSTVPGVFVTERGVTGFGVSSGAAGKVSIRGVGSGDQSELLIMIDGQPQVMGIFGHGFPDMYQTSNYEKVEIIRGPASVLYGSNAMGGVINLITRKQNNEGISARATVQAGSYNTYRGTATAGYKKGGLSVFGSYNHDQTDGHRANSAFRGDNGYAGLTWKMNNHFDLGWTANFTDFYAVDPGSEYTATPDLYANNGAWAKIKRGNTMLSMNNHFDKINGHLKVFYNQGNHSIYDGWVSTDKNYGLSLFEGLSLIKNNLIGVGIDWNEYGGIGSPVSTMSIVDGVRKMVPSEYNDKWIDVSEGAFYAFVQHKLFNSLTFNGGLRYSIHSLYGREFIPQAGATWEATRNDIFKALASKGYRSPTVKDLYFFPPANPNLQPEEMWNYEIGYSHYTLEKKLRATITIFYIDGENMILTLSNPAGFPPMLNQNSGAFVHYGAEVETAYQINPNFQANASYSYLCTDAPRIASPKHQIKAGGNYTKEKFDVALSAHYVTGLYTQTDNISTTTVNEEDIQNYILINAKVNYRLLPAIHIFISGDNLLNSHYSINYGYAMPGITVMGGLTLRLN